MAEHSNQRRFERPTSEWNEWGPRNGDQTEGTDETLLLTQVLEQMLGVLLRIAKEYKLDHQHRYVRTLPSVLFIISLGYVKVAYAELH